MSFRLIFYYASRDDALMAAYKADEMAVARIEATAKRFADQFGAVPAFTIGFDSHFAGIMFDKDHPCYHPDLWTKPTDKNPCVLPRSPERAGSKMRETAEALYKRYYDTWPKEEASPRTSELLKFLKLAGTDLANQLMVYHEVNGIAYIATTIQLALDEITAGQFQTAQYIVLNQQPAGAVNG